MDCVSAFHSAMQSVLGPIDELPIADGSIHRFHLRSDRQGSKNGWYVLFPDGIASGCFGSWKAGGSYTWSSREPVNAIEQEQIRQRIEQARQQRQAQQLQRQQQAASYADRLWRDARRADPDHPYLAVKGCRPYSLRQHEQTLLVPLYHAGQLVNLQRIGTGSDKRFLAGGRVKGCYSPLGIIQPGKPLYICEGWATGATLHAATGNPVACAMNAGNLLEVGLHLRQRHPEALLIVAGDDDRLTPGNPGKAAAMCAAASLGCDVVMPPWPDDAPEHLSDFNDLRQWQEVDQ